eukprot:5828759-Amphidinium_carterae.2
MLIVVKTWMASSTKRFVFDAMQLLTEFLYHHLMYTNEVCCHTAATAKCILNGVAQRCLLAPKLARGRITTLERYNMI